ncbi:efflux RND transporter periplasmic adaptor subunit [Petroclostridium sp. X23]|uniref:efflux RND transporter periplasmic adaptor subunit n=1 Tax=Petroclostridium sp. X23 TaxID=3045146 RepID=UPI0024AE6382|nr:efflux RND transporter periplasmic adaptor subunit [Petroclostridium sp. X23]WHH60884.1 efflux RND transporter periplasmic adaptor subunit [Petroclostridium sp. X23]
MKKMIWIAIIIVVLIAAAGVFIRISGSQAVEVDMDTVEKGDIYKYVEETAVVQLENEVSVYARESGSIVEIYADIGGAVKAGDLLVKMDDTEVVLQKKALEAQKQSIAAQYEEMKRPVDQEEIRKLEAQMRSAQSSYEEANREVSNHRTLYEEGAISFDVYQKSLAKLTEAEANIEVAKSNIALAKKGISGYVKKQYEAQIAEVQARIDLLTKKQNDMVVKAPVDGIVMDKETEIGSTVQPGTLLMELGSEKGVFLESDILVDEISDVKQGAAVLIENEDLGIKNMKGTVRKIYPKAFSKMSELGIEQKRVKLEIDFDNDIRELKSGYDVNVKIITDYKENTIVIDEKAIFDYQGQDHVFVNENGTAKLRAIKKGIEGDEKAEVLEGLKEGEKIILSPDEKLAEGVKIK